MINYFTSISLIVSIILCLYIGHKVGIKQSRLYSDQKKSHLLTIQTSVLGLISFLLGFTFSISIHHFDERSLAMKEEANAIGTTYLRAYALPETTKEQTLSTLRKYTDVRIKTAALPVTDTQTREPLLVEANMLRTKLWDLSMTSVKADDRITTSGLYVQALNNLIDSYGTRDEAIARHIPPLIMLLLVIAIIFSASLIGYTSGISMHRPSKIAVLYLSAVVMLTYVLIDLDKPRQGIIKVSQKNMLDLQSDMRQK
jgi:hypothetical protein